MRLLDVECGECQRRAYDVWEDEVPACCGARMRVVFLSSPSVDARAPFKVLSLGGPSFTSYRQMESYAKQTGQVVLPKEEQQKRRGTLSMEERLKRNMPEKIEAFRKAKYRLQHGYVDHPKPPSEKELKTS